ncbi:hypothetical protein [Streptosporangium carneum]|uniref:Uncharacterized protein n=1 Tax=Streptosporangium carneum TaxID=47481 RepID=A0A9W6I5V5_9ACTN|nr:hypothetical protein [Streptosporangium carneum]GLK11738.1 hypothetical protein GCM10017600_51450 [Streptosporangium carneum]
MSPESIEPVMGQAGSERKATLGRFLAGAAFVVPLVVSCGGVAMASAAGPGSRTVSDAGAFAPANATGVSQAVSPAVSRAGAQKAFPGVVASDPVPVPSSTPPPSPSSAQESKQESRPRPVRPRQQGNWKDEDERTTNGGRSGDKVGGRGGGKLGGGTGPEGGDTEDGPEARDDHNAPGGRSAGTGPGTGSGPGSAKKHGGWKRWG